MLSCLYYSLKANQAIKQVLPLNDTDFATHFLCMCPAKWQLQYNLTENTTLISTRDFLLVLENIENNAESMPSHPVQLKQKGLMGRTGWS
jgi:hypothetical protein